MKKISLIIISLFMAAIQATAQDIHAAFDVDGGPMIGATMSTLSKANGNPIFRPTVAGFCEVYFSDHWSMDYEIGFEMLGSESTGLRYTNYGGDQQYSNVNVNYITNDLLIKWYPNRNFAFLGGLHVGTLAYATINGIKDKEAFKNRDVSLPVGVSLNLGKKLFVEAKYYAPLYHIFGHDELTSPFNPANHVVMLSMGYRLPICN